MVVVVVRRRRWRGVGDGSVCGGWLEDLADRWIGDRSSRCAFFEDWEITAFIVEARILWM